MNLNDVIIKSERNAQRHPEWTQEQTDTKSVLDCQIDDFISENPTTDITEQVIEIIIRQARIWIERNLPVLMEKVSDFFDYVLDNIGDWVMRGLGYLGNLISEYF